MKRNNVFLKVSHSLRAIYMYIYIYKLFYMYSIVIWMKHKALKLWNVTFSEIMKSENLI